VSEICIAAMGVSVERSGHRLLDKVTLEVAAGEVVGVVGPNGAGKSTLLRVLSGDLLPESGHATMNGVHVREMSLQRLARLRSYIGPPTVKDVVFRVRDVVTMGRHPYRVNGAELAIDQEIVATAMQRADVFHLAERVMRTLSSGEQQRVGFARALAQQTRLMLLDEPTSALDVGHQEMVMTRLRDLAAGGVSVIAVLHDLNLAAAHVDRVLLLDNGRTAAVGTPHEVLTAGRLSAAYRQPMQVIDHPFRDCPLVLTGRASRTGGSDR